MHAGRVSRRFAACLALPVAVAVWMGCRGGQEPAAASGPADVYTQQVQPVLSANCYRCHGGMNHRGGLRLDSKAGIMAGGKDGQVIVPGQPENSLLIKLIRHEGAAGETMPMPPKSKLSDEDIAKVTEWIRAGAVMPDDPK